MGSVEDVDRWSTAGGGGRTAGATGRRQRVGAAGGDRIADHFVAVLQDADQGGRVDEPGRGRAVAVVVVVAGDNAGAALAVAVLLLAAIAAPIGMHREGATGAGAGLTQFADAGLGRHRPDDIGLGGHGAGERGGEKQAE